jgi:hypothetical protein
MSKPYLSADDLPSYKVTQISELLLIQLEEVTKKRFFLACNSMVRIILSNCHWYFKINSGILVLLIVCNNIESYQNIMITVPYLAETLQRFANQAQISISSPVNNGIPWLINIDDILPETENN